jgi:diadenosine tetraphosphate (Ap4A) HIT family hydrolase
MRFTRSAGGIAIRTKEREATQLSRKSLQTPPVHFHIIPRYRQRREFAGGTFVDPEFGDHYGIGPARNLSAGAYAEILAALRRRLAP